MLKVKVFSKNSKEDFIEVDCNYMIYNAILKTITFVKVDKKTVEKFKKMKIDAHFLNNGYYETIILGLDDFKEIIAEEQNEEKTK